MAGSTTLYCDRGFVTINGQEWEDLKTAKISRKTNVKRVDCMTSNYRGSGFKFGNLEIEVNLEMEIRQLQAQFDLFLQDPTSEIDLVFEAGGERYTVKNIQENTTDVNTSVGDGTKSCAYLALDITNENGISVNSTLQLG